MNAMQMPWGSHRGEWVENLPTKYLEWVKANDCWKGLPLGTQRAINLELWKRKGKGDGKDV